MARTRTARTEDSPVYLVAPHPQDVRPPCVFEALAWLESRIKRGAAAMEDPRAVKDYLRLRIAHLEYEVFGVLFLNGQHRLIEAEEMFRGTLTEASVYPREVVRRAMALNAAAVVLYHNHPSGMTEPSRADEFLSQSLKSALALVDVRVLDHVVVSESGSTSFAER